MPRRFWRRRIVIISAFIVVLSLGIVVATIPYLPHPSSLHQTIQRASSVAIPRGNTTYPSYNLLQISGLSAGQNFAVGVQVNNSTAQFCVLEDGNMKTWAPTIFSTPLYSAFPWSDCIAQSTTASAVLAFQPTTSGLWDVAVLNVNPAGIVVNFLPA